MELLNTQAILIIFILAGIICRKTEIIKKDGVKAIANLLYYLYIPALFLNKISSMDITSLKPEIIAGSFLPVLFIMLVLFLLKVFSVLSRDQYVVFNLIICFGSNAFFGIPFFSNLYGATGQEFAVKTSIMLGVFGIIAATIFFELFSGTGKKNKAFINLLKNPLLLSISVGILFSLLKLHIGIIDTITSALGQATNALAILILGMFIYDNFNPRTFKQAFFFALFRVFSLPIVTAVMIFFFFNSDLPDTRFLLLQSGIPVAISIAVFAEKYNFKKDVLSNIVVITSVLSFFSLTLLYYIVEHTPSG